jgi:hypothetical protein
MAAGETETTQENIQEWLEPDKGNSDFSLTQEEIAAVIFFLFISISITYVFKFSIHLFSNFLLCLL